MIDAYGTIYLKVNFHKTFNCDEDGIEEYIENNLEEFLEDDIEVTDVDVTDVEEISREWAMADEYYENIKLGEIGE